VIYRAELDAYCARHNLEVVETYDTWGEAGTHFRAIVKDKETGERYYLYYDRSYRRKSPERLRREWEHRAEFDLPPSTITKPRGWRNTTLDNRKRAVRQQRRRDEDERMRQQMEAEPGCNGYCNPDAQLYEATCDIHGTKPLLEALTEPVENTWNV
jgi:hypothetical protein